MRQLQITPSITNRDTQAIETYFNDIGRSSLVTAEEEVMLAQKIRQGDPVALDKLTRANLRFVVSVAKKYQHQGLPLGDLISEGNIGLIMAAKKFDETKGFKFISYAVWWIRQCIMLAIAEHTRTVRLPMNQINMLTRINRMSGELEGRLERQPTTEELAEWIGTATEKIEDARHYGGRTISYDTPLDDDDFCLLDRLKHDEEGPDGELLMQSKWLAINGLMDVLSKRERKVIEMSFGIGYDHAMENPEIARHIGMTSESIRTIKKSCLLKLKERAETMKSLLF